jgi:hypothetical protein
MPIEVLIFLGLFGIILGSNEFVWILNSQYPTRDVEYPSVDLGSIFIIVSFFVE